MLGSTISKLVEAFPKAEKQQSLGRMLAYAAIGLVEEERGNANQAIDYFDEANKSRPGTFEQLNGEWITDHLAELLVETGELNRLETILRTDIVRRDTSLWKNHPERAFVRIRFADFLVENGRMIEDAKRFLSEAKEIYDYHGEWIPDREHETLNALIETAKQIQTSDDGQ